MIAVFVFCLIFKHVLCFNYILLCNLYICVLKCNFCSLNIQMSKKSLHKIRYINSIISSSVTFIQLWGASYPVLGEIHVG